MRGLPLSCVRNDVRACPGDRRRRSSGRRTGRRRRSRGCRRAADTRRTAQGHARLGSGDDRWWPSDAVPSPRPPRFPQRFRQQLAGSSEGAKGGGDDDEVRFTRVSCGRVWRVPVHIKKTSPPGLLSPWPARHPWRRGLATPPRRSRQPRGREPLARRNTKPKGCTTWTTMRTTRTGSPIN